LTGHGLAYSVGVGASAVKALIDDYCAPTLDGIDVRNFERNWAMVSNNLHRTGSGGTNTLALAAIDIAAWDLIGKSSNLPLYRLLGGARDSIPAYRSGIDIHLDSGSLKSHIEKYLTAGYDAVKIKVGRKTLREDLERVATAREVMGPDRRLLLDANQRWHVDEAIERIAAFEQYRPMWIEEPLRAEDISGHARLRQATRIPIAVGESLYTKQDFLNYLRAGAVDVLQPDVARVGGITEWLKIAHLAESWGLRVAPHFLLELSVHLLCGVPNGLILENVEGGSLVDTGLTQDAGWIRNGVGYPTDSPGHGISFDFAALSKWEVTSAEIQRSDHMVAKP
jgi:L-alanine-DL-glutamate epimerase-like enolase superfamily enzyme